MFRRNALLSFGTCNNAASTVVSFAYTCILLLTARVNTYQARSSHLQSFGLDAELLFPDPMDRVDTPKTIRKITLETVMFPACIEPYA